MRKLHILIASACLVLGAATAYAGQAGHARDENQTVRDQAMSLMAKGNNWLGTNVFKRLVEKDNSPLNRFNLATGYQRTGRLQQAESIYRDLLAEGQHTTVVATPSRDAPGARVFNLAEEAASRLLYFDWLKSEGQRRALAQRSGSGAASADTYGAEASATVGGPAGGEVSDEQAAALDSTARQGVGQ